MKKNKKNKKTLSRRGALKLTASVATTGAALSVVPTHVLGSNQSASKEQEENQKFLIVLTNFGGGSINDSFLALSESEVRAAGGDPAAEGEEPRVEYAGGRPRCGPREAVRPLGHGAQGDLTSSRLVSSRQP